jgi:hypothetical protein
VENCLSTPNYCRLCGTPVEGHTTLWCVGCYRLHTHRCPTCQDAKGKTLPRFHRRRGAAVERCPRCGDEGWVSTLPTATAGVRS